MIYIRSLIFNIICYSTILLGSMLTCVVGLFSQKAEINTWNNVLLPFLRGCLYVICGMKIEVRGREHITKHGVLYACKHQSAMETYFLTSYVKNGTFIFKKELSRIPFFGWAIHLYGSVPVDRSGGSAAMKKMLADTKALMEKDRSIIIFPEGTRTKPGSTVFYKPGIAFLYQNIQTEVVPVALNTGMFWRKNSFLRHPGKVIIEFMPPLPHGMEKREFINTLQDTIEKKCAELNLETVKHYPETRIMLEKPQGK